jgi:uncharacterized protein with FMN-binding domain
MPRAPEHNKSPGKKITGGLVALSSAAIVTVYAAGYTQTQSAAAQFDSPIATTSVTPTVRIATATVAVTSTPFERIRIAPVVTTPTPTTAPLPQTSLPSASISTPTATSAPAGASGAYRDGSYTGLGRSRHGDIGVTVIVQGGKITAAKISQCGTRYPCSMISALPGEVVAHQSANVDFVSGATDSSTAFTEAVANALAKGS